MSERPSASPRVRSPLRRPIGAIACALAVLLSWIVFVLTRTGQTVDALGMFRLFSLSLLEPDDIHFIHTAISFGGLAAVVIVVAVIALSRRRFALGVRAIAALAGANITTQLLKGYLFARPDLGIDWVTPPSLPSGHTTAAASTAVAFIMVVPTAWRTWASIAGSGWALFIGFATLFNGWHRPSDVFAAMLVAGAWGFALAPYERGRVPVPAVRIALSRIGWACLAVGVLGVGGVAARVRSIGFVDTALTSASLRTAADSGWTGIAAAVSWSLAIVGVTLLVMRGIDLIRVSAPTRGRAAPPRIATRP